MILGDYGWLADHPRFVEKFKFTDTQISTIFAGTRFMNKKFEDKRKKFIDELESSINIWQIRSPKVDGDLRKRQAESLRDKFKSALDALESTSTAVFHNGAKVKINRYAYFDADEFNKAKEMLEKGFENSQYVAEMLKFGGRPDHEGKALIDWIKGAYYLAFEKEPSLNKGGTFEKLLGNIQQVIPENINIPTDPRILKPT